MIGTNTLCKIYNLYKGERKLTAKIGQLFYFFNILFDIVCDIFIHDDVIYRENIGNHTGHIWGSSQRAWMGEYTELERGRSKN